MVVPGYWANPEATAASFTAGYWHSGDLGSVDAQGFVRVFDRKKDMLNRGGYKIYSVEVENVLMAWPGMVEAAVVGKPCPVLGERVHAVLHAPGVAQDDAALRRFCAERLADYKVPESFAWSDAAAAAQCQRQADEAAAARCRAWQHDLRLTPARRRLDRHLDPRRRPHETPNPWPRSAQHCCWPVPRLRRRRPPGTPASGARTTPSVRPTT